MPRAIPISGTPAETVVFVGNKASANEQGYLPVMIYTMTPDGTLSQATYENMVTVLPVLYTQNY